MLGVALAVSLSAPMAMAQKPPDVRSQLPAPARNAWDSAQSLERNGNHSGAAIQFMRAYDLSHNPRVLFNVAVAEKNDQHYARATEHWERELREGDSVLSADEKTEIKHDIEIVSKYVTTIEVAVNEPDATVFVDDVEVGKSPLLAPIRGDVGERGLKISKEGFVTETTKVMLKVGIPEKRSFVLQPDAEHKKGLVTVTVEGAAGATVFMDGKDMGPAPWHGEVSAEHHTFTARLPGYSEPSESIDLGFREARDVKLTMAPVRHQAKLRLDVTPAGAIILVDHKVVEGNHFEGVFDTRGGHSIAVRKQGYTPEVRDVTLQDDEVRELNIVLNEERVGKTFIWWMVGTLAVVGGGAVAAYFVFKPSESGSYQGTFPPGIVTAHRPW